jgi:stage II sporulation SpoAA-like protein
MATVLFETFDDFVLLVRAPGSIPDQAWDGFLSACSSAMERNEGSVRVLVISEGGGPNAAQRMRAFDRGWRQNRSLVAVVTDDAMTRGISTVFAWFGMNIKAFSSRRSADAFDFLRCNAAEIATLKAAIWRLQSKLGLASARELY